MVQTLRLLFVVGHPTNPVNRKKAGFFLNCCHKNETKTIMFEHLSQCFPVEEERGNNYGFLSTLKWRKM
jgi:hypothetical protein